MTFDNRVTQGLFPSAAFIYSKKYIETGGEYVEELQKVGVRTLIMPDVAWVWVILGGQRQQFGGPGPHPARQGGFLV